MSIKNVEFKAKTANIAALETKLMQLNPIFIGTDNQIDTYYHVLEGRLKLREGNIENALIWYKRDDYAGAKQANIILYKHTADVALKNILEQIHGIKIVVVKKRKIFFIDNVKFHFDEIEGLGSFIEVEAIDTDGNIDTKTLSEQCQFYAHFFEINEADYQKASYSDMMIFNK